MGTDDNYSRRSSRRSTYNIQTDASKAFANLVVLKILFFDIGVSFGDFVTDILQGYTLLTDQNVCDGESGESDKTWYGIVVLCVCWIPANIIAVIHIITHHRMEFF